MDGIDVLKEWLGSTELVLFDFDGPLCDVFAGHPAPQVAHDLKLLAGDASDAKDPLMVLHQAARRGISSALDIEDALVAAEVRAVSCSTPTADGLESLRRCLDRGLRVGIVSNNSEDAVTTFLKMHGLAEEVSPVVGREYRHPELMKPNPWPMRKALTVAGVSVAASIFVGDSLSDIEVAHAVSMRCVAYANQPDKRAPFEAAGAATISSMRELVLALE
jgi:phosphoglycolate phosphatase-like HAD superfamily hydrolase